MILTWNDFSRGSLICRLFFIDAYGRTYEFRGSDIPGICFVIKGCPTYQDNVGISWTIYHHHLTKTISITQNKIETRNQELR